AIENMARVEGIGKEWAEKLVQSGFLTIEGITAAEVEDLEVIEGVDRENAEAIIAAAEAAYKKENS
ncbi:MAG: helix-hairpin-helix domain-containing protein, partial [Verrucomicrobiota bacterium]